MNDNAENTILIFGASSGIGLATLERLGKTEKVIGVSRSGSGSKLKDINQILYKCDIRNYNEVEEIFFRFENQITCVINCVGVGYYAPIEENYFQYWKDILNTNVLGLINIISNLIQFSHQCRQFIHIGSLAAHRISKTPGNVVYSASKTAAIPLLQNLRSMMRLRKNLMKIICLDPGYVDDTHFKKNFFISNPDTELNLYAQFSALKPVEIAMLIEQIIDLPSNMELSNIVCRPVEQKD